MSHRESETDPDRGTNDREGALSLKILASVQNTKYAIVGHFVGET